MNRKHLDPIDHAAGVLSTDAYSVRMDKRAEYEKKHPTVYFHGSATANAFLVRSVVAALLCLMFYQAIYKPWVALIIPNTELFILPPAWLFFVVLSFRAIGIATFVLIVGFLGVIAGTVIEDSRREEAKHQKQQKHVPVTACEIYLAAVARHQKEVENLTKQKCLVEWRAHQSVNETSPARPSR